MKFLRTDIRRAEMIANMKAAESKFLRDCPQYNDFINRRLFRLTYEYKFLMKIGVISNETNH